MVNWPCSPQWSTDQADRNGKLTKLTAMVNWPSWQQWSTDQTDRNCQLTKLTAIVNWPSWPQWSTDQAGQLNNAWRERKTTVKTLAVQYYNKNDGAFHINKTLLVIGDTKWKSHHMSSERRGRMCHFQFMHGMQQWKTSCDWCSVMLVVQLGCSCWAIAQMTGKRCQRSM